MKKQPRVSSWLVDLADFINVTDKLNSLNRKLQEREKHVAQMIGAAKSSKA
jgi:tetrahydromethanopterin S-methyltransferase subunit G